MFKSKRLFLNVLFNLQVPVVVVALVAATPACAYRAEGPGAAGNSANQNALPPQGGPPRGPGMPGSANLPAEVGNITFSTRTNIKKNGVNLVPLTLTAKKTSQGQGGVKQYSGGVVVKTPDFTFKAEEAIGTGDWVFLRGKSDVERKDKKYQATNMFIRRQPGGMIEYSFSSLTDAGGQQADFSSILRDIRESGD